MAIVCEEKLNGFRCILEKLGDKARIKTEGNKDRTNAFGDIADALKKIPDDFILDCSMGIDRKGRALPRIDLMTLMADKPELEEGDVIRATLFDLPYWKEDIHDKPLSYRREQLEGFISKYLKGNKNFGITNFIKIKDKSDLERQFKKLSQLPQSEGILIKDLDSRWETNGAAEGWAKIKLELEGKVIVFERHEAKGGNYNYTCGVLKGDSKYENTREFNNKTYIDLGKCYNTKIKAEIGDILTVGIEEVIPQDNELDWLGARVIDIDPDRTEPYFANQLFEMAARRGNVLQKALEEGETRAEIAEESWKENWYKSYPLSGKGRMVYHHHWRGLTEDETKLSDEQLLNTEHSIHGDLRLEGRDGLFGFSIFLGTTKDVKEAGGDRLANLPENDKLQGAFKLEQPKEWLNVGIKKPYISEPSGVGATENKYAKFFAIDSGTYDLGVMREHFIELFLHGKELKGRYLIQFAPVGGKRIWLISKPKDQMPYIESHDLGQVKEELKQKKQEYLVWAKPGEKPKLYKTIEKIKDVESYDVSKPTDAQLLDDHRITHAWYSSIESGQDFKYSKEQVVNLHDKIVSEMKRRNMEHNSPIEKISKSYEVPIWKMDKEKRLVYGIVLEPDTVDSQGDKVSKEEIEIACHKFLKDSRMIYSEHSRKEPNVYVVENYIAPENIDGIKKGSWVMVTYCGDNDIWNQVKKGKFTGYSIRGFAHRE